MASDLKKEMIGIGLFGLFIFLFVSLISYHPFDPSFNTLASGPADNLCGKAGSYTADLLMQIFGMMSYGLTLCTLFFSLLYIKKKEIKNALFVAGGIVLCFLSLSVLLQTLVGTISFSHVALPFSGMLGLLLEKALFNAFNYFGSILLELLLLAISLFLMVQVPLVSMIHGKLQKKEGPEPDKDIKIIQAPKPEKKEEKKAAVQESFEFLKDVGPYKLPPPSLLDAMDKKEVKVDREDRKSVV